MTMIIERPGLQSPSNLQPTADAAPIVAEWSGKLPTPSVNADVAAAQSARVRCNLWLTILRWPGPIDHAAAVAHELVHNAVLHGSTEQHQDVTLGFALTQHSALLIEVTDERPLFPGFDATGGGLARVRQRGAALSWFPTPIGKTVQARFMAPTVQSRHRSRTRTPVAHGASLPACNGWRHQRSPPEVVEMIVDDVESVLGPGSPVAGFSSWSGNERPDTRAQQPLALTVADLRLRLDFLIFEAASWDPQPAAEEIERAESLADTDLPADVDEAHGLLNLMALAAMDLPERLAPSPRTAVLCRRLPP
ncbi:hypothetical protein ABZY45_19645 [Streptomyces sp. NPDC006516]|uniref:hypothetical protein n=1 Tax=Streptomyces sp. NPDC006516 TaxID=3154309 RepID=UPI00339FC11E